MGAPAVSPRARPAARPKPKPKAAPKRAPRSRAATPARKPPPVAPRTNYRSRRRIATPRRSRSRIAAGGNVAMLPVNAVGGLADSPLVIRMSRGRAWIVVLGVLLGGIVAVNVVGLSLSSSGSDTSLKVDELQQANSVLRARIANRLSNERIAKAADALGLSVPAPDAVDYLGAKSSDAEAAAKRLAQGLIANAPPTVEPTDAALADPTVTATTDPAATTVPVDPATTVPVDPTATTATTAAVDPTLAPPATTP